MAQDYYELLGVKRGAGDKEIRRAFRKLARQYHPDVNQGDKQAEAKFKEINAAYEVLSDEDKRKKYDKYGDRWQFADQIEEMERQQGAGVRFGRGNGFDDGAYSYSFEGSAEDLGDLGSLFGNLFGRGRRGAPMHRRGDDVEYSVEVTLEEAFAGTQRVLQVQSQEPCPACSGTGVVGQATCQSCNGHGVVLAPKRIEVKVPAGVQTGSRVRVSGEGQPGMGGGTAGDLFLVVTVRPHRLFERKGDDLYVEVEVPLTEAVLGGEAHVPTPKGSRLALRIPPETQNGRQFRLAGQGMPHLSSSRRGDLYAKVKVVLPTGLNDEQRALFERLAEVRGKAGARAR
jgi:DnaJ-class molecular chaperone